ncbi:MarR family winged helix-turn-helix transcriptional regulator [Gracilibacillus salinarum]|uniref:MarR family transcriptional regulator n=1 Tax=Gracilibacillus salinarum TaxID=2932255 RepID=A0ABY4GL94_9BACI|nr:MarR family transcriptional regulator [Gracilibacillus salinarum]UOQ84945.1 MarR family transcriptional regulator [Gracilibacillus salinarum]
MSEKDVLTHELVDAALSVLPLLPKKLFGTSPVVKKDGLHPSHFHVLRMIEREEPIQMTFIAKKLDINKSNLTPIIQKLIEKDFIKKKKDAHDRRITYLEMTECGERYASEMKKELHQIVQGRFAKLTDEEKNELHRAFDSIHTILTKLE